MMNKDNYKNAMNKIHASEELKEKTINRIKENKKVSYIKYLSSVAVVMLIFSIGMFELNYLNQDTEKDDYSFTEKKVASIENDLPRFSSIEELKNVLKDKYSKQRDIYLADSSVTFESEMVNTEKATEKSEHSTTNIQVENVDEADLVKTDGEFIYYTTGSDVIIVNADEMNIVFRIKYEEEKERFYPREMYVNDNKLIVLGNYSKYEENVMSKNAEVYYDLARIETDNMAKAIVYDISNKAEPKMIREVALDGNYTNSRMIGDNIYFISTKEMYYYEGIKDSEILPRVKDSLEGKTREINCTDIAYFKNSNGNCFMLVGGFNINNMSPLNIESFWGASNEIYASEKNLYITQTNYSNYVKTNTIIYKFKLEDSQIELTAKGEVEGYLDNQFSMDEYEGNLRVATNIRINKESISIKDEESPSMQNYIDGNRLYVLDENLTEIGRIDNLAKDEKIYSVRFIGKLGYIVTFKQVDPLFVIDLSDPTTPQIKGELKIPGYSSYLHPYDENHIIGIGYNTKEYKDGRITNSNMKMSMFDVSDVENPKEMFSIDIGDSYAYAEVLYNHKALFYKKSDNLIGFSVDTEVDAFEFFKIDLENGFERYGKIIDERYNRVLRTIYIDNTLYSLGYNKIISYDLLSLEKIKEIEIENNYQNVEIAY